MTRDAAGWTAELRIPYSQLRFVKRSQYVWGINFRRDIARKNEFDYIAYTPRDGRGFVSRFPDLVGIERIEPPRRLEIMPYATTRAALHRIPSAIRSTTDRRSTRGSAPTRKSAWARISPSTPPSTPISARLKSIPPW